MAIIKGDPQIAKYLGMSPATLWRHRKKDGIPVIYSMREDGHRILVADTKELDAWAEKERTKWEQRTQN